MIRLLIFFLLFSVLSCSAQKKTIKYKVTQTRPYCGGARPNQEILDKAQIPHPYANKKFIYISEKGKIDSLSTNDNGLLTLKLSPGTYKFFEPWKYHKRTPDGNQIENYDKGCLEETWKKEDLKVTVTKSKSVIESNIQTGKCPYDLDCLTVKHLPE